LPSEADREIISLKNLRNLLHHPQRTILKLSSVRLEIVRMEASVFPRVLLRLAYPRNPR